MKHALPLLFAVLTVLPGATPAEAREAKRQDQAGDALPEGALARMGSVRFRSDGSVECVAFAADGKTVLTGGYSNKITFWDVGTGKEVRQLAVPFSGVRSIQFTDGGKSLFVTGGDAVLRLVDVSTGAVKKSLQDPTRRYGNVWGVLSPDGKTALMLHRYERQMVVWDVPTSTIKHRVSDMSTYSQPPVAFTPDSKQFITVWNDGRLHLIDVGSGKSVRNLEPAVAASKATYNSRIPGLALTPDGKHVVYRGNSESFFTVQEVATGKVVRRLPRSTSYSHWSQGSLHVTPNGRFLLESAGDSAVRVWGLASGKLLRELSLPFGSLSQVALSRDGQSVAAGVGHCIHVWDLPGARHIHHGLGHQNAVTALSFTPDGKRLISGGALTLRVWDAESGRELHLARPSANYTWSYLHSSPDGKAVRWVGPDKVLHQWRIGDAAAEALTAPRATPYYSSQAVSPDGKLMAGINGSDRKVRLIDLLRDNKPDRELATVSNPYSNLLLFSPDAQTLAVSGNDRTVTLFNVFTGLETRRLMPGPGPIRYYGSPMILFSPDSQVLLVFDGDLRVVETASGSERVRLPRRTSGSPSQLAWSEDGRLVACGESDGQVVVYDTYTGREVLRRNGGQGAVNSLAFSRDGRKLASGGANTTALVWEVPVPGRPERLAGLDDDGAWRDLEDFDAARAFRAMTHLIASPADAVRLMKARLKPPPPADPARIKRLIADLDGDSYEVREKASADLAELGLAAEEALKAALASPSPEVQRRAKHLMRRLEGPNGVGPDRLRARRAVEVLERIGTGEARGVLQGLLDRTKQPLDPLLENAIRASLERMSKGS
jgi:WD40 repeat protein